MSNQAIDVGSGLSGLSAAHTILERGGKKVLVLVKNSFFGALGVQDSAEILDQDTARAARDLARPDFIKVLAGNSASAVKWLQEKFKLDLSLVSRLGGHSQPRTHRGKEIPVFKKTRVTKLIKEGDAIIGVEYVNDGQTFKEYGPVILATGDYAADFTEDSLLKKYRPDIYNLPTTNGEHSAGNGYKMVIAIGGKATHMEKVQVHPTGLLLLNGEGKRFCDELGHREYVTGEIWKIKKIEWHCKHYVGHGLMRKFSGEALAKEIVISASQLKTTILFGKKFFPNVPIAINDQFHVDLMSPVLHYTMSEVRDMQEQVIPGLFASEEIAGGVHGANRLEGSSLLGCVVYGRVAGDSASRQIAGQLAPYQTTVSVDPTNQKVHLEIFWGSHKDATSQYTPPVQAPQASPSQVPAPEQKADTPTREKK
ncbi:hypothetical protein C2G38_2132194 [Gigaspora rosea]|uniref:FAD-dependent oxidoreductase 2 FAD-binding domain-containing protein n=1 Tax=Gigaspora rosea TaxID=44941 RepID=A0A397V1E4_9GLOM|nr:hypothetical protein C2G38_2132194 [Gigaspora rosea]